MSGTDTGGVIQAELQFDPLTLARRTDPPTSHEAAESAESLRTSGRKSSTRAVSSQEARDAVAAQMFWRRWGGSSEGALE